MRPHTEILIIAATENELAPLKNDLPGAGEGFRISATGAGKVSAALATLELIQQKRPDWIIQIGCAGAYPGSGLTPCDAAIANLEIFADEGVEAPDGFLSMEDIELPQATRGEDRVFNEIPVHAPAKETLEAIRSSIGSEARIEAGRFCTVSSGSGTDAAAASIEKTWAPIAESMEGAAAALVAWKHGIRFSEIRGISNMAGHRNREGWKISEACENAGRGLRSWLELEKAGS